MNLANQYVIARENNVVRVDFRREPDPPAPRFPGAGALRIDNESDELSEASPVHTTGGVSTMDWAGIQRLVTLYATTAGMRRLACNGGGTA